MKWILAVESNTKSMGDTSGVVVCLTTSTLLERNSLVLTHIGSNANLITMLVEVTLASLFLPTWRRIKLQTEIWKVLSPVAEAPSVAPVLFFAVDQ